MATKLISQSVKNLVQGISQQPPFIRYPEQLETQINGLSTEVDGLQKRPPTVFKKSLSSLWGKTMQPLVHFINRDSRERYVCVFGENTVRVFTLDGEERTVNFTDSGYLNTNNPRKDLQVITVADHSFVLNKTVTVRMTDKHSPDSFASQGWLAFVKQGQYGRTYTIYIDGVEKGTYTTPDGSNAAHTKQIDTSYIADQLTNSLRNNGITVTHENNWMQIHTTGRVVTKDGFNNASLVAFNTKIQRFSNLPYSAPDGFTVKVLEDPTGSSDASYYVKYDAAHSVWVECVAPNIQTEINNTTMPHILVREVDGTFSFKPWDWATRKVGDEDSNPLPSFIDNTITCIFFYRNRLGLSSMENVCMSESGVYANMWLTTANDLLDTDCIDVSLSSTKSNIINYIVVYAEDLYAFTNDTQFILRASNVLSPKSCSFAEITQFTNSPNCEPKVSGKNLYFTVDRGKYTSLNEYYTVQDVSALKNAQDISAHVPNYIPSGVYELLPSTITNIILLLSSTNPTNIYVYKYLFSSESRVQSSWSNWTFEGTILGAGFISNQLYLVIKRGDSVNIEYMDFSTNIKDIETAPYRVYLDNKQLLSNGVFDIKTQRTAFNIKEAYGYKDNSPWDKAQVDIVTNDGHYYPDRTLTADGVFYLEGDFSNIPVIVGLSYLFKIMFSTIYIKQTTQDGSTKARTDGRTQLKYINLQYDNSGYFKVEVVQHSGSTYNYIMNSRMLGTKSAKLGANQDDTGVFRFPVHAQNTTVDIGVQSDYPVPLALVGMSWECLFTTKVRGV